jgi:hypothetical protein
MLDAVITLNQDGTAARVFASAENPASSNNSASCTTRALSTSFAQAWAGISGLCSSTFATRPMEIPLWANSADREKRQMGQRGEKSTT